MGTRRAALDGLTRILDAGALEDLFTGPDDEATFVYDLLVEVARGRSSACYWEICRTARRRGVSPEYVTDRAAVLLTSIDERRRIDAYRILGVAGLASPEAIRHRWLEFAKTGHPDVGGDPARFRRVKDAYELLREPAAPRYYEPIAALARTPRMRRAARCGSAPAVRREPAPARGSRGRQAWSHGEPPAPVAPKYVRSAARVRRRLPAPPLACARFRALNPCCARIPCPPSRDAGSGADPVRSLAAPSTPTSWRESGSASRWTGQLEGLGLDPRTRVAINRRLPL